MISSTLAILFLFSIFTGIGLLFPSFIYRKEQNFYSLLSNFWIGWALVIAFLQLWHLVLPVGPAAFAITAAAGVAGWIVQGKGVLTQARSWDKKSALVLTGLSVIPALMLANHVMFTVPYSDHGLYHMQAVTWIENYAIVPGLGNLHHRLAFNNSNFLYAALINWGPLQDRAYFVSNALFGWVLVLTCGAGFYRLFRPGSPVLNHNLYFALMLPVAFNHLSTTHLPGYSPDVPNFILQAILAGELLRLMDRAEVDRPTFQAYALYMVVLVAVGITIKLAFAAFGGLILLALLGLWIWRFGFQPRELANLVLPWAGWGLLLVLPWLVRNVILSGYLLFPSMVFSFPVPWKMPEALVEPIAPIIADWARTVSNSFPYTADLPWFLKLWDRFPFLVRQAFVFTLAITGLDIVLVLLLRKKASLEAGPAGPVLLSGIAWLALIFWFVMAPDYRFSGAVFWILLSAAILAGYRLLTRSQQVQPLFLASAILLALTLWLSPNHFSNNLSRRWFWMPPPETEQAEQAQSLSTAETRVTDSGLTVYVPPPPADSCWHLPLPCTPPADFVSSLQLINPDHLQKGFKFPNP